MRSRGKCAGKGTARRQAPLERWHRIVSAAAPSAPRSRLAPILFQFGKLQFELIEQAPRSEDCPNCSCRSLSIVSFSSRSASVSAWASASAASAAAHARRALGQHHRLQGDRHHRAENRRRSSSEKESQSTLLCVPRSCADSNRRDQPAACGRHVCCGIRQSMPSSR